MYAMYAMYKVSFPFYFTFLIFLHFILLHFIYTILLNLFFSVVLTNFWITENTLKGEGSLFTLPAERVPLSDEHFSDFPPNLISGFMWMQITAEVPLNLYRTPPKTVRATIQNKFFNIYVYIYFYAVQIGSTILIVIILRWLTWR